MSFYFDVNEYCHVWFIFSFPNSKMNPQQKSQIFKQDGRGVACPILQNLWLQGAPCGCEHSATPRCHHR